MKRIFIFFVMVLFLLNVSSLYSQMDTRGTDFWLTFGNNLNRDSYQVDLQIRIVGGDQAATGSIDFTGLSGPAASVNFAVAAGEVFTYSLNNTEKAAVYNTVAGISNLSVHITSTVPVTAYALNQYPATTDATNILPIAALDTNYYHIGASSNLAAFRDAYAVIATQSGTEVRHDNTLVATLNEGQVYYRTASVNTEDMTGAHIIADKPVAFFALQQNPGMPFGHNGGDCLFQQLTPVNTWGKNFFVPVTRRGLEHIRIVASQDGTTISKTGGTIEYPPGGQTTLFLDAGQWIELGVSLADKGCYIQADKPVEVCSYMLSSVFSHPDFIIRTGDVSLAVIPPVEQSLKSAIIAPFIPSGTTNLTDHYAIIITPTATKDNTTVKIGLGAEQALSGGQWYDNVAAGMSFYDVPLSNTLLSYLFANENGLTVMGYGFGPPESYYYLAASAMRTLDAAFYVNDIHYQDLEFETICTQPIQFRAEINGDVSNASGYLKWYINDVEEFAAEDLLNWSKNLTPGVYQIKMIVLMDDNVTTKTVEATLTVVGCLLARDDVAQTISGMPVTIDVLANDELGDCPSLVPSILSQPANGSASVSGNQIIFTPNAGFMGQTWFEYEIGCNGSVSSAIVYITILQVPDIALKDSCSTQPKLQITIQYVGATYAWYYSAADDGVTWDLISGEETVTLLITEGGFYKAKISYNGMILETLPVELVIDRKVLLPGNVWWYQIRKL